MRHASTRRVSGDGVLKWTAAGARGASGRRAVCRAAADIERDVDPVTHRHRHTAVSGVSAPTDSTAPVIATAAQVTASPAPSATPITADSGLCLVTHVTHVTHDPYNTIRALIARAWLTTGVESKARAVARGTMM